MVRDKAFWEKFEAGKLKWDGALYTEWGRLGTTANNIFHDTDLVLAETEFSTLEDYGLAQVTQHFYRLSYLDKTELEMFHRQY
ncbi:hypothetical protein FC96_GL002199 [Secundilactobacillus kimchicus JCM 15530]|uniref:Uncharacterized protein n=1 Tax=Secundilactobacillus kimchicus JCM 15530 TaxID=1302272 RepID=A0A0R1HW81_9LACO|nr:hypothetical protein FC96_GL002199 [Secundilactobacillus kimchicus JCM 15530]